MVRLGELAEHDHADVRVRLAESVRDADALAVPARRHPQVGDDDVRRLAVDRLEEGVAVAADGRDRDPVQPAQHLADRLAHQVGVVGERDRQLVAHRTRIYPCPDGRRCRLPDRHQLQGKPFAESLGSRQTQAVATTSGAYAPTAAAEVEGTRVRSARDWVAANARQLAVVALPPVAVSSFLLGVTSEHLVHPRGASAYWTYLVVAPVLVGLLWWRRRPASRLGPLLVALGYMSWPLSWQGSDVPLIYSIGVVGITPLIAMSVYLCLAFSTGRLQNACRRPVARGAGLCAGALLRRVAAPLADARR